MSRFKAFFPAIILATIAVGLLSEAAVGTGVFTIANGNDVTSTQFESQRKLFRNTRPNSNKYHYALFTDKLTGLNLYQSPTGETWNLVGSLTTLTDVAASVWVYDTGSALVAYVAYGYTQAPLTPGKYVYYCRISISDSGTVTIGSPNNLGVVGSRPFIIRDRNGYVHIAYWGLPSGTGNTALSIAGTTTPNPPESPSFICQTVIAIGSANEASCQLASFDGSGNVMGYIGFGTKQIPTEFDQQYIYCRNIISFDGASYSLGTQIEVESLCPAGTYRPISAVVDSANFVHMLYVDSLGSLTGVISRKTDGSRTVEAWGAPIQVADFLADTVVLSIDKRKSPNVLYAFFESAHPYMAVYRTSPTSVVAWSDTAYGVVDADLDWLSASSQDNLGAIDVAWTLQTSPYRVRFTSIQPEVTVQETVTQTSTLYSPTTTLTSTVSGPTVTSTAYTTTTITAISNPIVTSTLYMTTTTMATSTSTVTTTAYTTTTSSTTATTTIMGTTVTGTATTTSYYTNLGLTTVTTTFTSTTSETYTHSTTTSTTSTKVSTSSTTTTTSTTATSTSITVTTLMTTSTYTSTAILVSFNLLGLDVRWLGAGVAIAAVVIFTIIIVAGRRKPKPQELPM